MAVPSSVSSLVVQLHNELRLKHGSPPVELDGKLSELAAAYAVALVHGKKEDEPDSNIGRNIFQTKIAGGTRNRRNVIDPGEVVRDAMTSWYGFKDEYAWDEPLSSAQHARAFSQLVWRDSTKIGVGIGIRNVNYIVVVLYFPVGNVVSDESYRENVLRPVE